MYRYIRVRVRTSQAPNRVRGEDVSARGTEEKDLLIQRRQGEVFKCGGGGVGDNARPLVRPTKRALSLKFYYQGGGEGGRGSNGISDERERLSLGVVGTNMYVGTNTNTDEGMKAIITTLSRRGQDQLAPPNK